MTPSLSVTQTTSTGIFLSWTLPKAQAGITQYILERGTDGVTFGTTVYTGLNTSVLNSFSPVSEQRYYYRVRYQISTGGYSSYSNTASAIRYNPVWAGSDPIVLASVQEGTQGTFNLATYASDADADTLTFAKVSGLANITVTSNGMMTVPIGIAVGTYSVVVSVTDGSTPVNRTFSVTVQAVVQPPAGLPSITSVSGTVAHGNVLTISGANFGAKSPAAPYLWAPMDGTANPSPLGRVTAWTRIQDMAYQAGEGYTGGGSLKATTDSCTWVAGVTASGFAWNDFSQQMYLFRRCKTGYTWGYAEPWNLKSLRIWGNSGGNNIYPDLYNSPSNGAVVVEGGGDLATNANYPYNFDNGDTADLQASRYVANVWKNEEILIQSNSVGTLRDAIYKHYVLGHEGGRGLAAEIPCFYWGETQGLKMRQSLSTGGMVNAYFVHFVHDLEGARLATKPPAGTRAWADDVYVDTTWARVMIGNAPTLAACTELEPQIPSAWGSNQVTVTVNRTVLTGAAYLFVINSTDATSVGYPIGAA